MKKFTAMFLAVIMVLGMALSASAAEKQDGPFKVKIKNAEGHQYRIYQIFTGDLAVEKDDEGKVTKEILSNVKYGKDYLPGEGDAKVTVDTLVPEEVLDAFKADVKNGTATVNTTGDGEPMNTVGDEATVEVEKAGYYMIVDVTTQGLPAGDTISAVMFQVVGDTEITSKHIGTTIVKKVQDINDSTGEQTVDTAGNKWIDSADYDINDKVPFKSTATFTGLTNYETYKVVFTDTMAQGLDYNKDMVIYVNGEIKTGSFTISVNENYTSTDEYNGGTQITITCDDITALTDSVDATIVLEYSATLNENANIGAAGNPNKINVTTTPEGDGEHVTPDDVNIVFTYKVVANKYANEVAEANKLPGAGFTLYKWDNKVDGEDKWVAIGGEVKGEAMTTFEWKGIDDGKYKLVETTTPAGYNTIDPLEFEVEAEHIIVADQPTLETLTGGDVFEGKVPTGALSGDIINNSGVELPETGGMGTTMFYAVGAVLVLAAVVLLVTKRRMRAE